MTIALKIRKDLKNIFLSREERYRNVAIHAICISYPAMKYECPKGTFYRRSITAGCAAQMPQGEDRRV